MLDRKIYLFGYSGHAYVIIDSLISAGYLPSGYCDYMEMNLNPFGLKYLGHENEIDVEKVFDQNCFVFPSVGSNALRKSMIQFFELNKLQQMALIDPSANISPTSEIGLSTYVGKNTSINTLVKIGKGVIVNTASVVDHECIIEDFTHIAPNATLCGNVHVGNNVFVGAGSVVKEGVSIGDNVVVGAGSVIIKDIPNNEIWVGNPAKRIKYV